MPEDPLALFNGKDLDGWVAEGVSTYEKDGKTLPVWSVKDGNLLCTGNGFGFLRYDRREFADFVFHVEFRMAPGCNSGLGIRTGAVRPGPVAGHAAVVLQLRDPALRRRRQAALDPPTGSLYRYVAPRRMRSSRRGSGTASTSNASDRGSR